MPPIQLLFCSAAIGAGVGAGSVFIQGKKELILDAGTEMSVRTTTQGARTVS